MISTSISFPKLTFCDISNGKPRAAGDISSAFKSSTKQDDGLDESYVQIKKNLIKDPQALKDSWIRLKLALEDGIKEIKARGSEVIPTVQFSELDNISQEKKNEILKRGCAVIKQTVLRQSVKMLKQDVIDYIENNPQTKGFPQNKKVVYELYWSKSQVRARSNANVRKTQNFMNKLWHAEENARISLDHNLMYADRMRIREPGDKVFALGPHADGGSLERWDDQEYSKCYQPIFDGNWEDFDCYDATHRLNVDMTKYDSSGTSSIFRTFQGWLSLSEVSAREGTILLAPLIKEVTAYWILRPFFDERDNLNLKAEFPGSFPGKSQEFAHCSHPDLQLETLMTSVPKVDPGDMVYWHCDCIHAVDPVHEGKSDSSVFYIPALPLCDLNLKYSWLQRESFLKGLVPPDFPGFPIAEGEKNHVGRAEPVDIEKEGGEAALQDFSLRPFKLNAQNPGEREIIEDANKLLFI